MRYKRLVLISLILLMLPVASLAMAPEDVPLITVAGKAESTVATDELQIYFDLTTEGETFTTALDGAETVVMRIREALKAERQGPVLVESEVQVLAHRKITWGAKTKKLDHRIILRVSDVKDGLPKLAMRTVDQVLALDEGLELSEIRGVLSDSRHAEVEASLLTAAVEDAKRSAEAMANQAGLVLMRARNIRPVGISGDSGGDLYEEVKVFGTSFSRGFRISAGLVGSVRVEVELIVQYEVRPK